jgi:glycosyltransferase involved in cell wall biosynthesis
MPPFVSVIMPAYGHERFVGQAIESVLAQTLTDWELIVIDDCSLDGTWDEIRRFRDQRIIASRHPVNRGAHATLNEGLAQARGSYVAILNSDDMYHAERLERTVGHLASGEVDLVGSAVRLIDAVDVIIEDQEHDWIRWYNGLLALLRSNNEIGDAVWAGNLFVTTSNFVFRRALASRVGGFSDLRYAHDYAFLLAVIARSSASVTFLSEESLLYYRWHGGNTIREDAGAAGREEFGVICRYFPLALPEHMRTRAEIALQHLSGLALTASDADAAQVARLHTEIDTLSTKIATLSAEIAGLRAEADRLRAENGALRGSYGFRIGSALLYPLRLLRSLVTGRH